MVRHHSPSNGPLAPDSFNGKLGRIAVYTHAHPATVSANIVNPVGCRASQFFVHKIMSANLLGIALGSPFLAVIAEISH